MSVVIDLTHSPPAAKKQKVGAAGAADPAHEKRNGKVKKERHHDGELEVDYNADTWADWDERCHGDIDTNSMRREYPEGFIWSCCEKRGDERGCKSGTGPSIEEMYATSEGPSSDEDNDRPHEGELELTDNETWDDWDERCHGRRDTKTHRREYPGGFRWSCCGQLGDEEFCDA